MKLRAILLLLICVVLAATSCANPATTSSASATQTWPPEVTTSSTSTLVPENQPQINVHFIDVGQGDSILIDSGQTEVLIDGGENSPGVVNYLSPYVDGALEVMVATHTHQTTLADSLMY